MNNKVVLHGQESQVIKAFDNQKNIRLTSNFNYEDIFIKVLESDDAVLLEGVLPGVDPKEIQIEYHEGTVYINMTVRDSMENSGNGFMAFFSSSKTFTKDFFVGDVDMENCTLELAVGNILRIYMPKIK